ncbi:MAG: hypothetical protein SGILL_005799, partial [Bacillariaceae sp.]
ANPSQLGDEYTSWYESAKDGQSAARMRMTYESYLTIPQIAEYLGTLSQEQVQKYAAFNPQRIYPATSTALNNEAMQTYSLIKGLQNAQSYQCYDKGDDSAGFRTAVKDQLSAAQSHYLTFSKLNENDIIAIQTEGTGSNIWQSKDMQAEYDQLFKDFPSCTLEPVDCRSWLAENCAAQGNKGKEKVNPKDWKEFQGIVMKYMQNDSTTKSKYGNKIGCWDVSSVADMRMAFFMTSFNEPLKCWDVSGVNNMEGMFYGDDSFNQDLSGWDTSRVKNMASMFEGAKNFNGNIIQWNVAKVNSMKSMFAWAESFNQPINGWSVDNVASFAAMFDSAYSFDKDVSSWQVSSAKSFQHMFQKARTFDQNLNRWNNVPRQQDAVYGSMFKESACPIQSDPTAGAWCQQQTAAPTPNPTVAPTPSPTAAATPNPTPAPPSAAPTMMTEAPMESEAPTALSSESAAPTSSGTLSPVTESPSATPTTTTAGPTSIQPTPNPITTSPTAPPSQHMDTPSASPTSNEPATTAPTLAPFSPEPSAPPSPHHTDPPTSPSDRKIPPNIEIDDNHGNIYIYLNGNRRNLRTRK